MSDGIKILLISVGAGIGAYVGIMFINSLCMPAGVDAQLNPLPPAIDPNVIPLLYFLLCVMFPVAIAITATILVLKLVQNA